MSIWQAILLAIVEGLTEFLPVSSTGHLIVTSSAMGIETEAFTKLFTIAIQPGAILAVLVLYWRRFFQSLDFYYKLLAAFLPAVVLGLLLNDWIDRLLESTAVVGVMLLLGGVVFLFIDRWFAHAEKNDSTQSMSYGAAVRIGLFQCLALIPGVSRSAATIIGGLAQGLNRKTAAEFSFFLAVPTLFAATVKKLYDYYEDGILLDAAQTKLLLLGNVVAFAVAWLAIKTFIDFITRRGFRLFGYYRIAAGAIVLLLLALGKMQPHLPF